MSVKDSQNVYDNVLVKLGIKNPMISLNIKQMSIFEYIHSHETVVDLAYQRLFSANEEFVHGILVGSINTIKDKPVGFVPRMGLIGGKLRKIKNTEGKKESFAVANGQHRSVFILLIIICLLRFAKQNGHFVSEIYNNIASLVCKNTSNISGTLRLKMINDKKSKVNETFISAVQDMIAFSEAKKTDSKSKFNDLKGGKKDSYSQMIGLIDSYFVDMNNEYNGSKPFYLYIFELLNRISISVYYLEKEKSEVIFYKEENGFSNPQFEEDFVNILSLSKASLSGSSEDLEKIQDLIENIRYLSLDMSNNKTNHAKKLTRIIYKIAHMSLAFKSENDSKFIAIDSKSFGKNLSNEVEKAYAKNQYSALTLITRSIVFIVLYNDLLNCSLEKDGEDNFYKKLVVKNLLESLGETKTRFLPFILPLLEKVLDTDSKMKCSFLEWSNFFAVIGEFLFSSTLVQGANPFKALDKAKSFPYLTFSVSITDTMQTLLEEFKKAINVAKLLNKSSDIISHLDLAKNISSNFSKYILLTLSDRYLRLFVLEKFKGNNLGKSFLEKEIKKLHDNYSDFTIEHMFPESTEEYSSFMEPKDIFLLSERKDRIENLQLLPSEDNILISNKRASDKASLLECSSSLPALGKKMIFPTILSDSNPEDMHIWLNNNLQLIKDIVVKTFICVNE